MTDDPTIILDFLRIVPLVKEERIEKMCSFRLYPAFEVETSNLKAPGAQYKQNPSFTMSISKACKRETPAAIWWVGRNLSGIHNSSIFGRWWRQTGSNRRPEACKATALPTELCPQLFSIQLVRRRERFGVTAFGRWLAKT